MRSVLLAAKISAAILLVAAACTTAPRFASSSAEQACAEQGAFAGANREAGSRAFARECASCHSLRDDGTRPSGPHLQRVVGRRVGSVEGFRYSPAFRDREDTWTLDALDRYLEAPEFSFPGTRMRYAGMIDADERRDVIVLLACPR